ncbi:MAG: arginine--tRNA ligase [Alphaproteobacteria bacterium]|nr:arginine--tRNA ligase [Alphaproteobacteria bacterium]
MDIYELVRKKIIDVAQSLAAKDGWQGCNFDAIVAEIPNDITKGEIATNAAMVLARSAKKNPRELGELIIKNLESDAIFLSLELAGPGFINIKLKPQFWLKEIDGILKQGHDYAKSNIGEGKTLNLEFASPNPTGPMHIGHARGAIYGDALASLLKYAGYKVDKEYYVNDAGSQIDMLIKSCYLRYVELCGREIGTFPEGCYPGEYLIDAAKELKDKHSDKLLDAKESEWQPIIREFIIPYMMKVIKADLMLLGVSHDIFFRESSLHKEDKIQEVSEYLKKKGVVYKGVLEPPKGKTTEEWESREQLLFKSTNFGDDMDRPMQKSDGKWTYFAADIAYLQNKLQRKYDELILVLGNDHIGYTSRISAACQALNNGVLNLGVKLCQMVIFLKDGKPFKMSKREGNFETVKDVVNVVGKDIIRFMMLTLRNDSVIEFDLAKVKETSKENPVFYVQYAYARSQSVLNNAEASIPGILSMVETEQVNLEELHSEIELEIIRTLAYWPKQVNLATIHQEPHRIPIYLINLATKFHSLWSKGKDNKDLRFIIPENIELTKARLTLLKAVTKIIESGLKLIGVTPVEKM